jgi:CheY-like chemotaxis protein
MQTRILLVDDDAELRSALAEQLALHDEFSVALAETGSKGVQAARAGEVGLVLLDVGLPDIDGREACKLMRRNGYKGPVIMLTGHSTDADQILGLDAGANDYVTKPFASPCCSRASAPSSASTRRARTRCSRSRDTPSAPPARSWSTGAAPRSGSPKRRPRS